MKSLKLILGLALGTTGLGGVVTYAVANNVKENNITMVEAAGSSNGYVFVDISGASSYSGDNIYCHNWGTSGTTWPGTKMTHLQDNIYYCQLKNPNNNMVIFNNNNGKQTGNLSFNPSSNGRLAYMDSDTAAHFDDKTKDQMDYLVGSSTTPQSDTTRLFIHHDDCGNWKTDATTRVRCWGSSKYESFLDGYLYDLVFFENSGTGASGIWYGYVDVPKDIEGWQLVRCNKDYAREYWNRSPNADLTGSFSSRIWRLQEYNWSWSWNAVTYDSAPGGSLMGKIVEAIDTCSSDSVNGYGAYSALNSNFYSRSTSAGKSQEATSLNGRSVSVQEHFEGMARRPASLPGSNIINSINNNANPVVLTSIIAVTSISIIGIFFFAKKRKHQ